MKPPFPLPSLPFFLQQHFTQMHIDMTMMRSRTATMIVATAQGGTGKKINKIKIMFFSPSPSRWYSLSQA